MRICGSVSSLLSMAAVFQRTGYSKLGKRCKPKILASRGSGAYIPFCSRNKVVPELTTALLLGISLPEPNQLMDFRGSDEPMEFLQTSPFYVCYKWFREGVVRTNCIAVWAASAGAKIPWQCE